MPLFRDLDSSVRTEVSNELLRRENIVQSLFLDSARRGLAFLLIVLLTGVALATFEAYLRPHTWQSEAALSCFLAGLAILGSLFCIEHEIMRRLARNFGWFKFNVLTDNADASTLISPPPAMRWAWVQPAIAYLAFALWIAGAAFAAVNVRDASSPPSAVSSLHPAIPTAATVGPRAVQSSIAGSPIPSLPRPIPSSAVLMTAWSRADKIALWAVLAALLQATALVVTFLIMRNSSRRQLRAFVGPETFDLLEGSILQPPLAAHTNEPGVAVKIKNFGQTVAYKVRIASKIAVAEPVNENSLIYPPLVEGFHSVLGPTVASAHSTWLGRPLTPSEITDVQAGAKAIYLYGRIEYIDVFKQKRFTTFRLRYVGQFPPAAPAIMLFAAQGNDAN